MPNLWVYGFFGDLMHGKDFMDFSQQDSRCYNARQGKHVVESYHASVTPSENGRASSASDNDIMSCRIPLFKSLQSL